MKIAFYEIKEWEKNDIINSFQGHEIIFYEHELNIHNCQDSSDVDVISIFIYSNISKAVLDNLHNLKFIATRSTGYDHIDVDEANKRNIPIANVPSYGETTVAEHTFALILNLSRNVHKSYLRTINHDFSIDGLTGFDLNGKTLGVVGTGHIGLHVIKIAKGFGMNVLAFDPKPNNFIAEILGFSYTDFDTLISTSNIITLHAPYNNHTHHVINTQSISKMKHGVIIINTSRGGLIDTDALNIALEDGRIGGVGLDVIEGETFIKEERELLHNVNVCDVYKDIFRDYQIFKRENVIFTPHNAFNSKESLERILFITIDNIHSFLNGSLINRIIFGDAL